MGRDTIGQREKMGKGEKVNGKNNGGKGGTRAQAKISERKSRRIEM